jgi:non-homologous end joining protein Ku
VRGIEAGAAAEPDRSNVVDLMAALKKSLGQATAEPKVEAETAPATTSQASRNVPQVRQPRRRASEHEV